MVLRVHPRWPDLDLYSSESPALETISVVSAMLDAQPAHDATLGLVEGFVWIVVPLAFFFSAIWAFAVLIAVAKGNVRDLRERVVRDRKAGGPWVHYWLSIPGAIGNLMVFAFASFDWLGGGGTFQESLYSVPLWWLPAVLLLISLPVLWTEKLVQSPRF